MKVTEHPGVMLLATKRDGSPHTGEAQSCRFCGRSLVEFVASPGLRALEGGLPEREVVCVGTRPVCIAALKAKKWLDALQRAVG